MPRLQSDNRHTAQELDRFADDMNTLIDSFCQRAKSKVSKFINEGR